MLTDCFTVAVFWVLYLYMYTLILFYKKENQLFCHLSVTVAIQNSDSLNSGALELDMYPYTIIDRAFDHIYWSFRASQNISPHPTVVILIRELYVQ